MIERAAAPARIVATREWAWASATFVGARHRLTIEAGAAAIARLTNGIGEIEFDLPGRLVADIVVSAQTDRGVEIEALVIEVR